jgi:hypothetical protein
MLPSEFVGKKVKVVRNKSNCPKSISCSLECDEFSPVGEESIVKEIRGLGTEEIRLSLANGHYRWPCRCDVIEETVSKSSDWNAVCQRCGAPAYQGLFKVECSKGCK